MDRRGSRLAHQTLGLREPLGGRRVVQLGAHTANERHLRGSGIGDAPAPAKRGDKTPRRVLVERKMRGPTRCTLRQRRRVLPRLELRRSTLVAHTQQSAESLALDVEPDPEPLAANGLTPRNEITGPERDGVSALTGARGASEAKHVAIHGTMDKPNGGGVDLDCVAACRSHPSNHLAQRVTRFLLRALAPEQRQELVTPDRRWGAIGNHGEKGQIGVAPGQQFCAIRRAEYCNAPSVRRCRRGGITDGGDKECVEITIECQRRASFGPRRRHRASRSGQIYTTRAAARPAKLHSRGRS